MATAYYVAQVGVLVQASEDEAERIGEHLEAVKEVVGRLLAAELAARGLTTVAAPSTLVRKVYQEEAIDLVPRKTHLPPVCGPNGEPAAKNKGFCGNFVSPKNIRDNRDEVTCKVCLRDSEDPDSPYYCGGCEKVFNTVRGRLNHECPAVKRGPGGSQ